MPGNRARKKRVVKTMTFSLIGAIVGIFSLALVFVGNGMAKIVYPDPPPTPLSSPDEIRDAIVDYAVKTVGSTSLQFAGETADGGKQTVTQAWDTVKGLAGKSPKAEADPEETIPQEASPDQEWLKGVFSNTALVGGWLALVLASAGCLQREDQRVCVCAAVIAIVATIIAYVQ
jgi:hypothetical protein